MNLENVAFCPEAAVCLIFHARVSSWGAVGYLHDCVNQRLIKRTHKHGQQTTHTHRHKHPLAHTHTHALSVQLWSPLDADLKAEGSHSNRLRKSCISRCTVIMCLLHVTHVWSSTVGDGGRARDTSTGWLMWWAVACSSVTALPNGRDSNAFIWRWPQGSSWACHLSASVSFI